jgi:anthranilate phosphoribosyltransferase
MFRPLLEKLARREDLTMDEAATAMQVIIRGDAAPAQIAGLLIGLSMKGERPAELVGLARTMRREAVPLTASPGPVFDTCGTGGDRSGTFQHLDSIRTRCRRMRRPCRETRQPLGVEPVRQC